MSNTVYYLYKKTHNQTGLKYLGKTIRDPFKYKGSGRYWCRHLYKHGNDVTTEIVGQYNKIEELQQQGLYYSQLWNIVKSEDWANLMPENGIQGLGGFKMTEASKQKMRKPKTFKNGKPIPWLKGKTWKELGYDTKIFGTPRHSFNKGIKHGPMSEETKQQLRKPKSTTINYFKPKSEQHKQNLRKPKPPGFADKIKKSWEVRRQKLLTLQ